MQKLLILFAVPLLFIPLFVQAEEQPAVEQESFRAEVFSIIEEKEENGSYYQDLKLTGKTGSYKNRAVLIEGLTNNISSKYLYEEGDIVVVNATIIDGEESFLITDRSRLPALYTIFFLFAAVVVLVGKKHGLKALVSLVFTFAVIVGFVVPRILAGAEPVSTVVASSVVIVVVSMLIVYGWNRKSKVAISGMLIGVFITAVLSYIFSNSAHLTGSSVEEVIFLKDFLGDGIDFKGLLLASFILGSLGVLDDIAITQVSTVQEIVDANKELKQADVFGKSMRVGVDHIASMINTLFLAYAGASFVLLLMFGLNQAPFDSFNNVINNEAVATEIMRTLVGSIGLILTVPITTYIASIAYSKK